MAETALMLLPQVCGNCGSSGPLLLAQGAEEHDAPLPCGPGPQEHHPVSAHHHIATHVSHMQCNVFNGFTVDSPYEQSVDY